MASYSNLFVDQGADFTTDVTVQGAEGTPLNLTNFDVKGQIRKTYSSSTAYDFIVTKTSPLDGEIQVKVDSDTTESLSPGRYVYDVYAEDSFDGTRFKIVEGVLEIIPSVTRFP